MGILNVTPDSFSDGGRWFDPQLAIAHGKSLFAEGADVVDVGGESTRPGADPVSVEDEIARVVPVVEELAKIGRVSIDTMKAEVADAAVSAGATLINDVSATLFEVAARRNVGWIAMHMKGEPLTMQNSPEYRDVVQEVLDYLLQKAEQARHSGVEEVWVDPGIGFGKTVDHNLALLHHIDRFVQSPFPVVVGASRKSFLGRVATSETSPTPSDQRLEASIAAAVVAVYQGVQMVRVHDVMSTVRAAKVARAIREAA